MITRITFEAVLGGYRVVVTYGDLFRGPYAFFYTSQEDALHHYQTEHATEIGCCETRQAG